MPFGVVKFRTAESPEGLLKVLHGDRTARVRGNRFIVARTLSKDTLGSPFLVEKIAAFTEVTQASAFATLHLGSRKDRSRTVDCIYIPYSCDASTRRDPAYASTAEASCEYGLRDIVQRSDLRE